MNELVRIIFIENDRKKSMHTHPVLFRSILCSLLRVFFSRAILLLNRQLARKKIHDLICFSCLHAHKFVISLISVIHNREDFTFCYQLFQSIINYVMREVRKLSVNFWDFFFVVFVAFVVCICGVTCTLIWEGYKEHGVWIYSILNYQHEKLLAKWEWRRFSTILVILSWLHLTALSNWKTYI